jgi:methionine aminotransferase
LLQTGQRKCTSIHAYVWLCTIIIKIATLIKTPEEPFSLKRITSYRRATSYFTTITALVKNNDDVIILSYDCYEAPVLCNANPVRVALNDDYIKLGNYRKACTSKNQNDNHQQSA